MITPQKQAIDRCARFQVAMASTGNRVEEESAGNLSDALEGLNLMHQSIEDSMTLSPLSITRSPETNNSAKPLIDAASTKNINGLQHPLATGPSHRHNELPMRLPPRPPPISGRQDR
jgi:hypothetical protein